MCSGSTPTMHSLSYLFFSGISSLFLLSELFDEVSLAILKAGLVGKRKDRCCLYRAIRRLLHTFPALSFMCCLSFFFPPVRMFEEFFFHDISTSRRMILALMSLASCKIPAKLTSTCALALMLARACTPPSLRIRRRSVEYISARHSMAATRISPTLHGWNIDESK